MEKTGINDKLYECDKCGTTVLTDAEGLIKHYGWHVHRGKGSWVLTLCDDCEPPKKG